MNFGVIMSGAQTIRAAVTILTFITLTIVSRDFRSIIMTEIQQMVRLTTLAFLTMLTLMTILTAMSWGVETTVTGSKVLWLCSVES